MGLFDKKEANAKSTDSPTQAGSTPKADPRSDPNLIRVFDEFGRELFITKEHWRTKVLPGTIKKNWDNPDQLYSIIVGSLNDGYFADVLEAANHLYRIDSVAARGACLYGIVLMKNNRLDEAETVLRSQIEKHGEEGYVLTNLAKVYSARNETQKAEDTVWHALEVDPNQDNGLAWHVAMHRDRSGEEAAQNALRRVAALPGSWRAQLWLARAALESRELERALAYYQQGLSRVGDKIPTDLLIQMGGDLGKHGYLKELLQLTEPRFVPDVHGLQVGNNLIKAHLDLGEIEAARKVLDELYALKRPDYKQLLNFWDTEIAKARIADAKVPTEPRVDIAMGTIEGPVWLKQSSHAAELFPVKPQDAASICFLGSSADLPNKSENVQVQIADAPGRMSRALPLYCAEQVWFSTNARVQTLVPWFTGKTAGFVLSGGPWKDEDAAKYALQGPIKGDFVVVTHLLCTAEPWKIELRLIRASNHERLAHLSASFQSTKPEYTLPDFAQRLVSLIAQHTRVERLNPPPVYSVPTEANFATYLLRLEQLLAVRFAAMDGVQRSFLNGEREIIDGNVQLCAACPDNVVTRILLASTLLAMKRIRADLVEEFRDKITLLQEKRPLLEPARNVVQRMFKEALGI